MSNATRSAMAGLGFKALFAAAIGVIVAQLGVVSSAQGIGIGGWGFVIALGIAFALSLANAFAYAEMSLMLPSQGSLSSFAEAAIGNFPAIMLVFAGYVTPALFGLPAGLILAGASTPHLDVASAAFGPGAKVVIAVLALLASASLINTVLAAVPRMLAGMADNGQVFPLLKYRHPRFGTPVVAILFVAALPLIGLFWSGGKVEAILPLMIAASVAWLMAYIMAQVSLMVLRARHPELPRPFKVPGYPVVPVLAIVGMGFVIANSSPAPELTRPIATYTGVVLAIFAVVGAVWVKAVMKKGLFEPVKPHLG